MHLARPTRCTRCGQPAYEGGRIRLHGHGLVRRQQRGPPSVGQPARTEVYGCRRYRCQGCQAVFTVLPAQAQPRKHFSGAAIALALALWGLGGLGAAQVRAQVSDWGQLGSSARGWRSLTRWARQAALGELFVGLDSRAQGSSRQLAARAAQALGGHAPPQARGQPLEALAFEGARHVS